MATIIKKTAESKVKSDKNGRSYKTCSFAKMSMIEMEVPGIGKVAVSQPTRETSVNLYEQSYLNDREQFGYSVPAGTERTSFVMGDIVTRTVKPYSLNTVDKTSGEITTREVNTFTTVVFGNTDSGAWESEVRNAFKSRGHELSDAETVIAIPANEVPATEYVA